MVYCQYCGTEIDLNSVYCKNCGKKVSSTIKDRYDQIFEPSKRPDLKDTYQQIFPDKPSYPTTRPVTRVGKPAEFPERCVALLIDDAIVSFIPCFGFIYAWFKDALREGQSVGKGFMGLRVVDFQTGVPASFEQSFIRNCCPGCLDSCCCYLAVLLDENGRRIGDHAAGTIVIQDQ
ncbi:MAG: RDD family protein [Promethearchaeota archaeon]